MIFTLRIKIKYATVMDYMQQMENLTWNRQVEYEFLKKTK